MHCSYCGMKSRYDDLLTEGWHCPNCGQENEAVDATTEGVEDADDFLLAGGDALVRHAGRMLWW